MIVCPRCRSINCKELSRTNQDNIDGLDHSHMRCEQCGYQFNQWNESEERLKNAFEDKYNTYCLEQMC